MVSQRAEKDGFDIETHRDSVDGLISMLKRYKLRKKVSVEADSSRKVFTVWGAGDNSSTVHNNERWLSDPRPGQVLGHRVWSSQSKPGVTDEFFAVSEEAYHQIRIAAGLPEGPEECVDKVPFVLNHDWWDGALSFSKGCYTGQELIARTHFKGQVNRRIVPVVLSTSSTTNKTNYLPSFASWVIPPTSKSFPPIGASIEPIETTCLIGDGTLISIAPGGSNLALATFRDAQNLKSNPTSFQPTHHIVTENGKIDVCLIRPSWWPDDAATESS